MERLSWSYIAAHEGVCNVDSVTRDVQVSSVLGNSGMDIRGGPGDASGSTRRVSRNWRAPKRTLSPRPRSSDFAQFGDSAHFNPFNNKDVALVIEAGSVGTEEAAGDERIACLFASFAPFLLR